jgi:hypothetical protein
MSVSIEVALDDGAGKIAYVSTLTHRRSRCLKSPKEDLRIGLLAPPNARGWSLIKTRLKYKIFVIGHSLEIIALRG